MADQTAETRFRADQLIDFIARAFEAVDMPSGHARDVGRLMVEADLAGFDAHGIFRLPAYITRIRAGGINLHPDIRPIHQTASTALVHGDNGMGHLVMQTATEIAIQKATETGIGWVGTCYSNHAGAASTYAAMPLDRGMIGLYAAVGSANHLPPWGGIEPLLSTNPIAVAIPAGDDPPVVMDFATTAASYGKIKAYEQRGETLPEGWLIDREGKPLTDPSRSNEGFLMPIGEYKGYALSLVIGLLAGTLNGAAMGRNVVDFNADQTTVTNTGQFIAAISPSAFGDPEAIGRGVAEVAHQIRGSATMPGVDRVHVPGDGRAERRQDRLEAGVPLGAPLLANLANLATELDIAPLA